uniref:Acetyltransferase, GNAT family n=1 Tax=uncultured organism TaxID=155900 RepID=M1PW67_9ZZZZ|nr:acetyltransferase, GNAT family [uncultured organism]
MKLEIRPVKNEEEYRQVRRIREKVFIKEQGISRDCDNDGKDEGATHLIAKLKKEPIGTVRIRNINNKAKLERISILKKYRNQGFGEKMVEEAIEYCKKKEVSEIFIHSLIDQKSFYEKIGFEPVGETFSEAGVEHIKMILSEDKPK